MTTAAIIVAAGRGTRAGGDLPKQWQALAGARVIDWTIAAFEAVPEVARVVVVLHPDDLDRIAPRDGLSTVEGGASRAASVRNGLESLTETDTRRVLIHDIQQSTV